MPSICRLKAVRLGEETELVSIVSELFTHPEKLEAMSKPASTVTATAHGLSAKKSSGSYSRRQ